MPTALNRFAITLKRCRPLQPDGFELVLELHRATSHGDCGAGVAGSAKPSSASKPRGKGVAHARADRQEGYRDRQHEQRNSADAIP
jgi:hypothetical protein